MMNSVINKKWYTKKSKDSIRIPGKTDEKNLFLKYLGLAQKSSSQKDVACSRGHRSWNLYNITLITIFVIIFVAHTPVLAAESTNITCGVILPLSGDLNATGTVLLNGIELAAAEYNQSDRSSGRQIILRIADDQGDPNEALSQFNEMQEEGIPVVIGSYSTDLTLPMAEETKKVNTTILISPQANGEALYGISPRFYQINPPIFSLAEFVGKWLKYSSDRVAVIYSDDNYGQSVLNNISSSLINNSIQISDTEPVTQENTDYSAISHKILDGAPDTIVVVVYDSRQIPIIRNLTDAGFRGQVILTESGLINTMEKENSDILSRFSLFTILSYTDLVPGEPSENFVSSYQKMFGQDPTKTLAGYGYDSIMVVTEALPPGCDNRNITAEIIQKGLKFSRFYGVTGPKIFDSYNAVSSAQDRWVFKDGRFVLMDTSLVK